MKTAPKIAVGFAYLVVSLAMSACGPSLTMTRGPMVPAAAGEASLGEDINGNAVVALTVERLAKPENLEGGNTVYVVWAVNQKGGAQKLGKLLVDGDGKGEFGGTIPMRHFKVIVTAEPVEGVEEPSSTVVFTTNEIEES